MKKSSKTLKKIPLELLLEEKKYDLMIEPFILRKKGMAVKESTPREVLIKEKGDVFLKEGCSNVFIIGEDSIKILLNLKKDALKNFERNISKFRNCMIILCCLSDEIPAKVKKIFKKLNANIFFTCLSLHDFIQTFNECTKEIRMPRTTFYGVLIDVYGVGVLIKGESGIGKSEVALELIMRGARLVSDDVVEIIKKNSDLYGTSPSLSRFYMEIRGLGIINIKDLFGVSAVRNRKKIEMLVEFVQWDKYQNDNIVFPKNEICEILGVQIPYIKIPVGPGRNLATIVEVAARNYLLKKAGRHSSVEFEHKLERKMLKETI